MKKMFKSLIFIVLAICPFLIKASGLNYEDTIHYVNNYIYKFPKYSNYLFFNDRLPFIYEKTDFVYDSKFKSGGLLSKTEFEISNQKNNTYLSNGLEYWTNTKSSASRHYVINYTLQEKLDSSETGVRITEYVNNNVGVSGNGSYSNPFKFDEIISLHVNSTNILRGKISTASCSNSSLKKETITLTFTDGTGTNVYLCPENGYRVLTNSCSSYMTKDTNNKYYIHDVKKDNLICNVDFTYITNKVTLSCSDCDMNASPNVLYSSVYIHDKWFTDKNATTLVDKINTKPSKRGYTFKGYLHNGNLIINSSGNILDGVTAHITEDTVLNANMEANTYQITLNAPNATSNDHTKSQNVLFDSEMPSVVIPQRTYTVNYNANGGTVSKASETISYSFDGYTYNNIKYINGNGSSAHKWDVDSNATLTGVWSGGTFNLAIPTRSGHVFEGWSKNSDGGGTLYKGQQEVFNLMSSSNTSVTLYAKWTKCSAGTYLSSNSCVKCSGGYYSAAGADNCSVCGKNTYSSDGASRCTTCAAGTYTTGIGSSSCIGCPPGSICPAGSDPQPCPVGYKCTPTTQEPCPAGYFSAGNAISCTRCPKGYYCPGKTDKISCPSGYTSDAGAATETSCYIKVSGGHYLATAKGTTTTACVAGKYKAEHNVNYGSTSNCDTCATGHTSQAGASSCTKINYTVTISRNNTNYGTVSSSTVSIPYGTTYTTSGNKLTFSNGTTITATPTSATGYTTTVGSWSSSSGTITGATTITVNFSRRGNNYSVVYNCNGGTPTDTYTSAHIYGTASKLKTNQCAKTGSTFNGWKDANGTTYTNEQSISTLVSTDNGSITLTAQWKTNTYKIAFAANGGSGSMSTMTVSYGQKVKLTNNAFTKAGHKYEGWSGSNGKNYSNGQEVSNLTSTNGATVTMTARWTKCGAGTYLSGNTCTNCSAGYYSGAGASSCSACPAGQYSSAGSSECSTCTAGYYCPGSSNRTACPAGTYSSAGASSCTACAAGSYTSTTGNSTCTACQGSTTSGTGKTSCDANCSNASNVSSWNTATWSANSVSNSCSISTCASGYTLSGGTCVSAIPGTRVTFDGSYWSWRSGSNCTTHNTCGTGMCNTVGVAHTELYVTEIKGSMVHGWFDISLLTSPGAGGNCLNGKCASVCKSTYALYETKVVGGKTYAKIQLADVYYVFRCAINGEGC